MQVRLLRVVEAAAEHHVDRFQRLLFRHRDDNALAGGETVGLITYMRTDGVQMDESAYRDLRQVIGFDSSGFITADFHVHSIDSPDAQVKRTDRVRAMPCLVPGCMQRVEACHARARGMGGAKGSWRDLVPLCREHHEEAGEHRTSKRHAFELRHGVSLTIAAAELAEGAS